MRKKSDFEQTYRHGQKSVGAHTVLYTLMPPPDKSDSNVKLGLTVSRRSVGMAVRRNKVKRWYREIFRSLMQELPVGLHMVWVARRGVLDVTMPDVKRDILEILKGRCW